MPLGRISTPKQRRKWPYTVGVSDRFDESDVKKIFELAMSFAEQAKTQSEWYTRMTNEKLDQTGKKRKTAPLLVEKI